MQDTEGMDEMRMQIIDNTAKFARGLLKFGLVEQANGIYLVSPYNEAIKEIAKANGGKWSGGNRAWLFSDKNIITAEFISSLPEISGLTLEIHPDIASRCKL